MKHGNDSGAALLLYEKIKEKKSARVDFCVWKFNVFIQVKNRVNFVNFVYISLIVKINFLFEYFNSNSNHMDFFVFADNFILLGRI